MSRQWMFIMSYLLLLSWTVTADQFYVVASSSTSCPNVQACYTLTDLVLNPSQYFTSDTIITLLPGSHQTNITREFSVLIKDVRNISMIGYDHTNTDSKSVIQCTGPLGFAFINVTTLKIEKLSFLYCGGQISREFRVKNKLPNPGSLLTFFFLHTINVTISEVNISNSTGAGIIGVNMFGVSNISQTVFCGNGPNCWIIFLDIFKLIPPTHLSIASSHVMFGKKPKYFQMYHQVGATGFSIILAQTKYKVHIHLDNIQTQDNLRKKLWYGNLQFVIENWECNCSTIQAKKITSNNKVEREDKAQVRLRSISFTKKNIASCKCPKPAEEEYTVQISDSYFAGAGMHVSVDTKNCNTRIKLQNITVHNSTTFALHISGMESIRMQDTNFIYTNQNTGILIEDSNITASGRCSFMHNTGYKSIVSLFRSTLSFYGHVKFIANKVQGIAVIVMNNSTMKFQQTAELERNEGKVGSAIALYDGSQLIAGNKSNVTFLKNYAQQYGGGILIDGSTMVVESKANIKFTANQAYDGGALAFKNDASIMLKSHSQITFMGNHALQNGGALHVEEPTLKFFNRYLIKCFFELPPKLSSHELPSLMFTNNTADSAGSNLYGGWVDFCINSTGKQGVLDFNKIFHFQEASWQILSVSSNPTRVCVCIKNRPDCNITHYNVTTYPGETFQIPAVAVGQRFGTVPFTVQSRFSSVSPPQLKQLQKTQSVRRICTNLTYSITSSHQIEEMILTVEQLDKLPTQYIIQHPYRTPLIFKDFHLHVYLNPCPVGFLLTNSSCTCHPQLQQHGINCNIDTQKVNRPSTMWINVTFVNTSQYGMLVHKHCPFDYCRRNSFDLNLEDPDEQCAFNRSGILCGACQHNLSHVFGTSACRECSNLWALLWVPVIALAGIALVVLLIVLDLTVSVGTINGLIFYANIVRANHATFFPPNTTNSFLSWFIAWINLDLGIETCFYNGLDAYVKTWLQFVFPLYIWFLVITIIVLSHYSTLAARLSGRNAVQVLSTLFLISYAKLLRIIITVFQSTDLEYPDSIVRKVWFYDGNVDYLKGKHIPLFIAALLLLLISLPYTAILTFIQYLKRWSFYKMLFWVQKLKPLFDAYTGPYKDRHCYWTGLLLLLRISVFLIISSNVSGDPAINLLTILIVVLCVLVYTSLIENIYKVWYLNALEFFSFLNLGLLSSATFYIRLTNGNQTACIYTSTAIALATFAIVIFLHLLTSIKSSPVWKNGSKKKNQHRNLLLPVVPENSEESPQQNRAFKVQQHVLLFNELREPLLESCNGLD